MRRTIYMSDVIWEKVKKNCEKRGMSISEYLKFLVTVDDEKLKGE